ncbi:MAG: hypothetical protein M0R48_10280 [Candidatus Omnitrophica bacterium]|nr:hypothetical protein [Candidatus Omnitrophota bacterium]
MISAAKSRLDYWDGVTVTTPQLVDGYYEIYDGATLMGFRKLPADGQYHKARLTADFAINDWKDFETWTATNAPPNRLVSYAVGASQGEFDGQGHTIYGLYIALLASDAFFINTSAAETSLHNIKFKGCGIFRPNLVTCYKSYNLIFEGNHIYLSINNVGLLLREMYGTPNIHSILFKGKSTGYYQHGALIGSSLSSETIKNIGIIGTVTDTNQNFYMGSIIGGNQPVVLQNCWQSATLVKPGSNARALAAPGSTFTNCYCDSTKIATGYVQGTPKTTAEIQTQAFVDLLNANLPAGCTPWKLDTDNYPTLDF